METFVTILQVLGGAFGLALLGYGVAQVERFADTLEKISDKLDAQANDATPDATQLLLEKLDQTIGRTYAAQPSPPVSRARTRTRKDNT